ncbi:heme-binding protein [uncultured Maribacter sp.]|uniref:GlcG/HbpS family heme-binding protein n=1 Tax=uncultured Maribacter sp. TaxID=431308 RepID=UPI0026336F89|nr:heme-binding protein [uncultured Maribacter sp.]
MPKTTYKMTHRDAKALMDAATKSARHHKVPGAIAIVDGNGNPILLESLDNTMSSAAKIAIGKAATATAFKRPTIDLEKVILKGRTPMLVLDSATSEAYIPLKGAYPILYKKEIIGGIAVAGTMDADMDEVVVLEALKSEKWE